MITSSTCPNTWINSYSTENGDYIGLDLGGTNFRVVRVVMKNGVANTTTKYYNLDENLLSGPCIHVSMKCAESRICSSCIVYVDLSSGIMIFIRYLIILLKVWKSFYEKKTSKPRMLYLSVCTQPTNQEIALNWVTGKLIHQKLVNL